MNDMSRYLFAIVLAMAVLFGWQIIFPPEQREIVNNEIKKFFKPEFINRLDEIVIFNNLELNDIKEIAKIQLQHLEKRLNKKN